MDKNIFQNEAAEFVFIRTYARWIDSLKRRETWDETVDRYMAFIGKHTGGNVPNKVFKKIKQAILTMNVMPSMRALWAAGDAAEATNISLYNCSFLPVDSIESFAECLYILCCGTGVGFSVQSKYTENLPKVPLLKGGGAGTFIVPDSKEGWADSLKHLLQALYSGKDLEIDYTLIRPKGSILKTFGGRASGPAPLINLHEFVRKVFQKAQDRQLKPIECHDIMNKIAEIVVVGGVRRSSQISFSDLNDKDMSKAKKWPFPLHRAMANNSVLYEEKPGAVRFLKEWSNLANSGTGERGIANIEGARKRAPERRNEKKIMGANPCQPGFATILTQNGIETFNDIDVGSIIWSGKQWTKITKKAFTGKKTVYKYTTNAGQFIGTENHKIIQNKTKVEVKNAESIDFNIGEFNNKKQLNPRDIINGIVLGDGTVHKASSNLVLLCIGKDDHDYFNSEISHFIKQKRPGIGDTVYEVDTDMTYKNIVSTFNRTIPDDYFYGNRNKKIGFLRGLFTANGGKNAISKSGKYYRFELRQTSKRLVSQVQEMLSSLGIASYITTYKEKTNKFANGEYKCKESYKLNITWCRGRFLELIGFIQKYKMEDIQDTTCENPKKLSYDISNTEYLGEFNVYDITVEANEHTYWTGGCLVSNCFEIMLRSMSFCNLSEVVVKPTDDLDDLLTKIETAVWIGAIQSTFTKFPYLRRTWKINADAERLLGVSITGQMDNPKLMTEEYLEAAKKKALKVCRKACKILGINMSAAITCVKPSGSVSQLVNSSSGLHPRFSKYYIRRYRIASIDPLFRMLKDQGVKMTPENGQREKDWKKEQDKEEGSCSIYEKGKKWTPDKVNTWILSFPIKSPKTSIVKNQVTAIEQLKYYKRVQGSWCEHSASCTIFVKDNEWFEVGNWVYNNWKYIIGVSFLPFDGGHYEQAPYEDISKEQYDKLNKNQIRIDYSKLREFETEDQTEGAKSYACIGDRCELK